MTATTTAMMLAAQGPWPTVTIDNLTAFAGGGQTAPCMRGQVHRFVRVLSTGDSACLPSLAQRDESARMIWVVNDSSNSMNVFAFVGDTMNGSLNGSLAVAAGAVGMFLKVDATLDWRGHVLT